MSKAFTKEDDGEDRPHLPSRAPLPAGVPNYVTREGLAKLEEEQRQLHEEAAALGEAVEPEQRRRALAILAHRRAALEERLSSARVVTNDERRGEGVRFGAWVTLRPPEGTASSMRAGDDGPQRRFRIVGVDEADASLGLVAFVSPLARALLGREVGDTASVRTPRGTEEWEIVAIDYDDVAKADDEDAATTARTLRSSAKPE